MFTLDKARQIFPDTLTADAVPAITARFKLLSAEDQLALIWFAYLEMGQTITVAAPGAARMELARPILDQILAMSFDEQTKVMCDLAAKINSPISSTYAYWSVNVKLCFWYELGEYMRQGKVAPIPQGLQALRQRQLCARGGEEGGAGPADHPAAQLRRRHGLRSQH